MTDYQQTVMGAIAAGLEESTGHKCTHVLMEGWPLGYVRVSGDRYLNYVHLVGDNVGMRNEYNVLDVIAEVADPHMMAKLVERVNMDYAWMTRDRYKEDYQ